MHFKTDRATVHIKNNSLISRLGSTVYKGLVLLLLRVPIRGEVVSHSSGVEFEIVEADPRRVKRIRVWKQKQRSNKQDITESA